MDVEDEPTGRRGPVQSPPAASPGAGDLGTGPRPPRVVRGEGDVPFVHYGATEAPTGLDRAIYMHTPPPGTATRGASGQQHWSGPPPAGRKSGPLAVALSVVLPGAGHWYLRRRAAGAALLSLFLLSFLAIFVNGWFVLVWLLTWVVSVAWCCVVAVSDGVTEPRDRGTT